MLKDKLAGVAAVALALYVGVLYYASCNAVYAQDEPVVTEEAPTVTSEQALPETTTTVVPYTTSARITAYCEHGYTASGVWTRRGSVAAGRHVPFGARLYIPGYGYGMVQDRGGAIYGNRLDVWMPTCRQAIQWGVRWIQVTWY